jgi:hypothetical protein
MLYYVIPLWYENYRGNTLLPTAYKLFANIIKNGLNEHLEDEMVEEQCGFRKGRSCTDVIHGATDNRRKNRTTTYRYSSYL